ncbi:polyprenyl synthetase family protein ['Paenibacillus yunnanensis' Narsing Rao et al. 2020]|uniref:polyprenyl synthetase family protein n=1 Tax=Paenibacillus tengchongensis TaxID=2608684 RepID=UPI00124F7505|nr:polyprenyl synthetase family protein [Paenibacillus tengchongensis]
MKLTIASTQAHAWYDTAEREAAGYFAELQRQVKDRTYIPALAGSFDLWKRKHIRKRGRIFKFLHDRKRPDSGNYRQYIQWLNHAGKLDDYLIRSVSYTYLRDLGQTLDAPGTDSRIRRLADDIKKMLLSADQHKRDQPPLWVSLPGFYRWAQKEGVERTAIWLIGKLKSVALHLPDGLDADHAQRKLIKIIIGVVMHVLEELGESAAPAERARRLDEGLRLGYSYGLTYPFIDDLLDSRVLNPEEKQQFSLMIRTALLTGEVPGLEEWPRDGSGFIEYVHAELGEAFGTIKRRLRPESEAVFFEQAYVFFHAQETDRNKSLADARYSNEELYLPVILKSASSRLIVRPVIGAAEDEGFRQRAFAYGIYNQLSDDLADMTGDLEAGSVTPYTYYLQHREERPDLINPFELYFAVIAHLLHDVYRGEPHAREVILSRAVNGLKRYRQRRGEAGFAEFLEIFTAGIPQFRERLERLVLSAEDVDFFDKLLRDQLVSALKQGRLEKAEFAETVQTVRARINAVLPIPETIKPAEGMTEPLTAAANYSLAGDGKRLRPVLTWMMGVQEYGLPEPAVLPLLKALEYMHTASLIFDDLPSQDNAASRRGRVTLHELHDSATAELTGLLLIQKAMEEQASLTAFEPAAVLAMIRYSAGKTADICKGQAMDLQSKGIPLTLEQLNTLCFYKTGAAFEAALVMPAMLARVPETEIAGLQKYAYHAGIAFQIRDDLLDLEGEQSLLGKPVGKDRENNSSTFVSILGRDGAAKAMWDHYCLATEALDGLVRDIPSLRHLLDYIVNREH